MLLGQINQTEVPHIYKLRQHLCMFSCVSGHVDVEKTNTTRLHIAVVSHANSAEFDTEINVLLA